MNILVKAGADVNSWNNQGDRLILLAAKYGNEKSIEILVKAGADVNSQNMSGECPVLLAVQSKQKSCTRYLIKLGADVNAKTNNGQTALMCAAYHGYDKCLQLLIEAGAQLNSQEQHGLTALFWAMGGGKYDCVYSLLRAGVDVNIADNEGCTALHALMYNVSSFQERAHFFKSIKALLAAGAKVNKVTTSGRTVASLYYQHTQHSQRNRRKVMKLLLAAGEQVMAVHGNRLNLSKLCRNIIREHLLKIDPHENLFVRVPRLGLPLIITRHLLNRQTLEYIC